MSSLPLLLLPGLNNTRDVFDGVVGALPPDISVSVIEPGALDDVESIADAVLAAAPERFALCGFSFGGYVALAMLERAPERIAGLAMIATGPSADTPEAAERRKVAIKTAEDGGYQAMVAAQAPLAFHPDNCEDADLLNTRAVMIENYGAAKFIAHSKAAIARKDRTHVLAARDNVLWLVGDADRLFPVSTIEGFAACAPGGQVEVLSGAGHLVPMERPGQVASALENWLRRMG